MATNPVFAWQTTPSRKIHITLQPRRSVSLPIYKLDEGSAVPVRSSSALGLGAREHADLDRSPPHRLRGPFSGPRTDDATISIPANYPDDAMVLTEEASMSISQMDFHSTRQKRRASSPLGEESSFQELPGSGELLRRREGASRGSPTPRRKIPPQNLPSLGRSSNRKFRPRTRGLGAYVTWLEHRSTTTAHHIFPSPPPLKVKISKVYDFYSGTQERYREERLNEIDNTTGLRMGESSLPDGPASKTALETFGSNAEDSGSQDNGDISMEAADELNSSQKELLSLFNEKDEEGDEQLDDIDKTSMKRVQGHPPTFQCTLCPKRFTRAYNLRSHLRTHAANERPFVCVVCGLAFISQNDRKRHEMNYHSSRSEIGGFDHQPAPTGSRSAIAGVENGKHVSSDASFTRSSPQFDTSVDDSAVGDDLDPAKELAAFHGPIAVARDYDQFKIKTRTTHPTQKVSLEDVNNMCSTSFSRTISRDNTSGNDHKRSACMAILGSKHWRAREPRQGSTYTSYERPKRNIETILGDDSERPAIIGRMQSINVSRKARTPRVSIRDILTVGARMTPIAKSSVENKEQEKRNDQRHVATPPVIARTVKRGQDEARDDERAPPPLPPPRFPIDDISYSPPQRHKQRHQRRPMYILGQREPVYEDQAMSP